MTAYSLLPTNTYGTPDSGGGGITGSTRRTLNVTTGIQLMSIAFSFMLGFSTALFYHSLVCVQERKLEPPISQHYQSAVQQQKQQQQEQQLPQSLLPQHSPPQSQQQLDDQAAAAAAAVGKITDENWSFLMVIIFTAPNNVEQRQTIRNTWLKFADSNTRIRYHFVLGTKSLSTLQLTELQEEHRTYQDLMLLNDLADSYENLSEKLIHSFQWLINDGGGGGGKSSTLTISTTPTFDYLLKVDDDSFVSLRTLYDELVWKDRQLSVERQPHDRHHEDDGGGDEQLKQQQSHPPPLYWGYFDGRARVKRTGQWMEKNWYLCDHYLPYALGGGYLISRTLVSYVVQNAHLLQRYRSEDVSLGVWLAPLHTYRIHDIRFDTEYKSRGCVEQFLIQHKQSVKKMLLKWNSINAEPGGTGAQCANIGGEHEQSLSYEYNWRVLPSKCCTRNVSILDHGRKDFNFQQLN